MRFIRFNFVWGILAAKEIRLTFLRRPVQVFFLKYRNTVPKYRYRMTRFGKAAKHRNRMTRFQEPNTDTTRAKKVANPSSGLSEERRHDIICYECKTGCYFAVTLSLHKYSKSEIVTSYLFC